MRFLLPPNKIGWDVAITETRPPDWAKMFTIQRDIYFLLLEISENYSTPLNTFLLSWQSNKNPITLHIIF